MSRSCASCVYIRVGILTGALPFGVTIWRPTWISSILSMRIQASQLEFSSPTICTTTPLFSLLLKRRRRVSLLDLNLHSFKAKRIPLRLLHPPARRNERPMLRCSPLLPHHLRELVTELDTLFSLLVVIDSLPLLTLLVCYVLATHLLCFAQVSLAFKPYFIVRGVVWVLECQCH